MQSWPCVPWRLVARRWFACFRYTYRISLLVGTDLVTVLSILLLLVVTLNVLQPPHAIGSGLDFERDPLYLTSGKDSVLRKVIVFPRGGDEAMLSTPRWQPVHYDILKSMADVFALRNSSVDRLFIGNLSLSPGMGNIMFGYAALKSLELETGARLLIPEKTLILRAFRLSAIVLNQNVSQELLIEWPRKTFTECCRFYSELLVEGQNVSRMEQSFFGYFQSWRYFHPQYESEIRQEFDFIEPIKALARKNIEKAIARVDELTNGSKNLDPVIVGVHIRRGIDLTWNMRNREHGHSIAPLRYLKTAMEFMKAKFLKLAPGAPVIFLIASDDLHWCEDKFKDRPDVTFVSRGGEREVDLCTLAMCNATVMSQGTFSWWGAYLANGPTIYYAGWPRPNSTLDKMTKREDFFLPHWKSLYGGEKVTNDW